MKILVTGGCGFIGRSLCKHLVALDHNVYVLDQVPNQVGCNILPFISTSNYICHDLRQIDQLVDKVEGFESVIHLAATSDTRASEAKFSIDLENSIVATWNLIEALSHCSKKTRLLFTSSQHVYGAKAMPNQNDLMVNESAQLKPSSVYGAGKVAAEAVICAYAQQGNFQAIVLRLTNVVGPHQKYGVLPDIVRKLKQNSETLQILGNGSQRRNFLHITDFCMAIEHLLTVNIPEQFSIFNVANAGAISVKELAKVTIGELNLLPCELLFSSTLDSGWKGDPGSIMIDAQAILSTGWKPQLNCEQAVRKAAVELWANY